MRRKTEAERKREHRIQKMLSEVTVEAIKDPERLLQPTSAFKIKMATPGKDAAQIARNTFEAKVLPKRSVFTKHSDTFQARSDMAKRLVMCTRSGIFGDDGRETSLDQLSLFLNY